MSTIAPTYQSFIEAFPVFIDVDLGLVQRQLSISTRLIDDVNWGDFYSDAIELDAAHNLVLATQMADSIQGAGQVAAGPINSVGVAGISTSFSTPSLDSKSKSTNWYMKTGYGQQFLRLRDTVISPGMMAW